MKSTNIVVIGGGTGTFTVLSGLKKYDNLSLTAIISTADDGGSNKKFRDEFGLLPPSDFRQCLVALSSDVPANDTMRKLMMYRFDKGIGLEGQTLGNILIAALTDIEGSQVKAFEEIGKVLNIKGKIIPVTLDNVRLMAEYEDGHIVLGEHLIDEPESFHDSTQKLKRLFLNRKATIYEKARNAIEESDYIILGPGDLYTSTIANLVVGDLGNIIKNSSSKIIYILNLMTKYGQTFNFTAKDHVREIKKYIGKYPDYLIINSAEIPKEALSRYILEKNDSQVVDDLNTKNSAKFKIIRDDLVSNILIEKSHSDKLVRSLIRHDIKKLANSLYHLIKSHE